MNILIIALIILNIITIAVAIYGVVKLKKDVDDVEETEARFQQKGGYDIEGFNKRIADLKEEQANVEFFNGVPLYTPKNDGYDNKSGVEVITDADEIRLEQRASRK